jgi:hypothetical protein
VKIWRLKPHDERPKVPLWRGQLNSSIKNDGPALITLPTVGGVSYHHDGDSLIVNGVKREARGK